LRASSSSARLVVIGCTLQGAGGGITQRLQFWNGQRNVADRLGQSPMLPRDPDKAIGKLRFVNRLLVENFEEPGDGLDLEAAIGGDDRVQPENNTARSPADGDAVGFTSSATCSGGRPPRTATVPLPRHRLLRCSLQRTNS
jgi:hypothetical protein